MHVFILDIQFRSDILHNNVCFKQLGKEEQCGYRRCNGQLLNLPAEPSNTEIASKSVGMAGCPQCFKTLLEPEHQLGILGNLSLLKLVCNLKDIELILQDRWHPNIMEHFSHDPPQG